MYLRALQGKEEALGAKHTSTLNTVNNLGVLYKNQGKPEAEEMLLRALQGYKEALGIKLVKTYIPALNTMWNLGQLYSKTRPDESQAMYAKALSGYTKVRGGSSDICLELKRYLDALNISRQDTMDLGLNTNSIAKDSSNMHKPPKREGRLKKLIRRLKN